ncbi:MAG TPA: hypothetical protein VG146_19245 [Verrucomicrobiae bacterium]|nr:hypothetical protein [Verrucomicrobiae bacterium]
MAVVIARFWNLRSPRPAQTSLTAAEVRQIVSIVAKKRWELVRFAARKREFKLLRRFALARIESVNADSPTSERATVRCHAPFEPAVTVIMTFVREGANAWRFERWRVIEKTGNRAAQPILPGASISESNALRLMRPANELSHPRSVQNNSVPKSKFLSISINDTVPMSFPASARFIRAQGCSSLELQSASS